MRTLPILLSLAESMKRLALHNMPYQDPSLLYRMGYPAATLQDKYLQRLNWDDGELDLPKVGRDGFQVSIDVAEFKPNELNVKVVDSTVIIEGKHEDRQDNNNFISRQFERRYELPPGFDASKMTSSLSSDGILTINAPKPQLEKGKSNERVVPIQQTGPAHISVKKNPPEN